jgi:AcrR family transcriptional regulator
MEAARTPSGITKRVSHTPKGTRAREKILRVAEKLLASSGFHGTSMRDVADAAGLPLASVVYHFARKEKLYAAVLAEIGDQLEGELMGTIDDRERSYSARLDGLVRALVAWCEGNPGRVKLLVRELLDNESRVAKASRLPLAPVLLRLSEFVEAGTRTGAFRRVVPEIGVLHLVGAVSYYVAARPTVKRIVGAVRERRMAASYEREAIAFARRMFIALEPEVHLHGSEETDQPGSSGPRARRATHDGQGRWSEHGDGT